MLVLSQLGSNTQAAVPCLGMRIPSMGNQETPVMSHQNSTAQLSLATARARLPTERLQHADDISNIYEER